MPPIKSAVLGFISARGVFLEAEATGDVGSAGTLARICRKLGRCRVPCVNHSQNGTLLGFQNPKRTVKQNCDFAVIILKKASWPHT